MESVSSVFKRNCHIDLRDVDFNKKLKLSTLFSYFQDVASLDAESHGFGIETLEKKFGAAWVLTRIRVEIIRMPSWDEEITIETWALKPSKIEFNRDYLVKDANGNIIVRAVSKWVIMDIKERKLKRTELVEFPFQVNITERVMEGRLEKLKHFGKLEPAYKKIIGYSDIDFNGHINNSKYVDYIMDCFQVEDLKNHSIQSIDINFNQEALPGDSLALFKDISKLDENIIYIEGENQSTQSVVFKSFIIIK
ncbi:acyl-[acyl-carrier-protein] thioesterase [Neobacillus mesonae]|uniref:acyl-[acyl-carrier-protein] thioesterase n=1 Tax=Neobacillus mesonae TaxID=1193713 RepID=UPI0020413E44|nr:acyl-ACP thioesterase domain-containing protein [Neobacillus mesonae]MCM3570276.1 thioesterase [Neobacillus mesonae]